MTSRGCRDNGSKKIKIYPGCPEDIPRASREVKKIRRKNSSQIFVAKFRLKNPSKKFVANIRRINSSQKIPHNNSSLCTSAYFTNNLHFHTLR